MSTPAAIDRVVEELTQALVPLTSLDSAERLAALLADLGWELPGADDIQADLGSLSDQVIAVQDLLYELQRTPAGSGSGRVALVLELVAEVEGIVSALVALSGEITSALDPAIIDDSGIRDAFVPRLVDYLVSVHVERNRRRLYGTAAFLGVMEQIPLAADPAIYQPDFVLRKVHWDRLPMLLGDPGALAELTIQWQSGFDPEPFIERMEQLVRSISLPGGLYDQDPALAAALGRTEPEPKELRLPLHRGGRWPDDYYDAGLSVSPLIGPPVDQVGLAFVPYFLGAWDADLDLGGGWRLEVTGGADAGIGPAMILRPDAFEIHGDLLDSASDPPSFHFEAALIRESEAGETIRIFGDDDTSRLELDRATFSAAFDRTGRVDDVDVNLALDQVELVISAEGADPFTKLMLPSDGLDTTFDLSLGWRASGGFHFQNGTRFDITIPVSRTIGLITLDVFHLTVSISDLGEIDFDLTADLGAFLAVFTTEVERVGLTLRLSFPATGGNLGPAQLSFGFSPPTRVSFEIATEAVNGGGFIEYFEDTGRYLGGLSLDIVTVGVDALVIVDTRLPGDPDGWAFYASLTATFPGIPIGFGFTLEGVGGLIGLNRSFDAEALAAGLRSGAVDSLLFPEDPVGDALQLAAQIDEYFPLTADNTVVGPIIQLGWGSPTLVTAQLGIVISFPQGLIAVMGSVAALLPDPDAPLLTINMDALGVVDIPGGTFSLTASLYDSRLLETIDLGGDMAMFLSTTVQPYFLLSVGGFHPGFEPPCVVPASMHDLRRMWAGIEIASNVAVSIEAYFALTSNSVQFGSAVNLEATVDVGIATYSARGWFAFDVLLEFSPFRIEASMSAGIGVYSGNRELMGVNLDFRLEGPEPWAADGQASFKFFGIKVNFAFEVGDSAGSEPRPIAHPQRDACEAMRSGAAWQEAAPLDGVTAALTYTGSGDPDDETVWVRADHSLSVRQGVAPLGRTLEIVGQAVPAADEAFLEVTGFGFGSDEIALGAEPPYANDWFAPAQFEELGPSTRLSRESFEEMPAGVTFGTAGTAVTEHEELTTQVTTEHEEGALETSVGTGAAGYGLRRVAPLSEPLFQIAPTAYTITRTDNGTEAGGLLSDLGIDQGGVNQYSALAGLAAQTAADPGSASLYVVVPATSDPS